MFGDQNAGRSHSMKTDNSSFEMVEQFKYLWTTLTIQNFIQEQIKTRRKSGNACYHLVQNILSSSLLSKNLKIKIYRTKILLVVLYGCKTWGRNVGWGCLRIGCWGEYLDLRGTSWQGSGENFITRSLMICTAHQIWRGWSNWELDGQGTACGRDVNGFDWETWGKETTWETMA